MRMQSPLRSNSESLLSAVKSKPQFNEQIILSDSTFCEGGTGGMNQPLKNHY